MVITNVVNNANRMKVLVGVYGTSFKIVVTQAKIIKFATGALRTAPPPIPGPFIFQLIQQLARSAL